MKKSVKRVLIIVLVLVLIAGLAGTALVAKKALSKVLGFFEKYTVLSDSVYYLSESVDRCMENLERYEQITERLEPMVDELENYEEYHFDYSWAETTPNLIAHALGGIDGNTYTNSLEAFEYNYELGYRIFEVDFYLTEPENTMVALHDNEQWKTEFSQEAPSEDDIELTYQNFKNTKALDKYTTLDYRDVIDLMIQYPDIYMVTDTKFSDRATVYLQFSQLVRYAMEKDPEVLTRLIPQVYHERMLHWIMDVYPFESVIYTLYLGSWEPEMVYDVCKENNIGFITVHHDSVTPEMITLWKELGIYLGSHTINEPERAQELLDMGIDFLYTDFLVPEQSE